MQERMAPHRRLLPLGELAASLPDGTDEVGPSGRLIPKGGEEDPGEILRHLKDLKLASDDIGHWSAGTEGDGQIYLNDDGEACKIDKRGVPYKIGSGGRRLVPSRRPKHLYSPEEWVSTR